MQAPRTEIPQRPPSRSDPEKSSQGAKRGLTVDAARTWAVAHSRPPRLTSQRDRDIAPSSSAYRGPGPWHSPRPPRLTSQRDKDIIPRRLRHNADQGRDTVPVLSPSSRPLRIIPFSLLPSLAGTAQIFSASSMKNVESPRKPVQSYRKSTNFNCLSENWSDVLICAAVSCIIQTKRGLRAFLARAASKQIQE